MKKHVSRLSSFVLRPTRIVNVLWFAILPLFVCSGIIIAQSPSPPLLSLVSAERGFAAATAHLGVRDGFLTFFADDAITFEPALGSYKEGLVKRPRTSHPLSAILRWTPEEGDVAASGDIGYLTGPYVVEINGESEEQRPAGWYFSIWKRQADSTWKVFIDVGIETPDHGLSIDNVGFLPAPLHLSGGTGGTVRDLQKADSLLNVDLQKDTGDLTGTLAPSCRFHRNGQFPMKGTRAVTDYLREHPYVSARGLSAHLSAAGDLGYAYGTYTTASATGYYIRIWKLDAGSSWRLVLDVTTEQT